MDENPDPLVQILAGLIPAAVKKSGRHPPTLRHAEPRLHEPHIDTGFRTIRACANRFGQVLAPEIRKEAQSHGL